MEREQHLGFQLRMLQNEIMRYIDQRARQQGLDEVTLSNGWILNLLSESGEKDVFQKDIEIECGIARSTVTGVVKLMEHKGLIRRESVPYDARLKKLTLTEKGAAVSDCMSAIFRDCERVMSEGLTPKERAAFETTLRRLHDNLLK